MRKILIIDDDEDYSLALKLILLKKGYQVAVSHRADEVLQAVAEQSPDCVLLDLKIGSVDGLSVLDKILNNNKGLPIIVTTGHESIRSAVEAMKRGAYHYLSKTADREELFILIERAIGEQELHSQLEMMKGRLGEVNDLESLMGPSEKIQKVIRMARAVASTNVNVLLTGESGSGKELLARSIHHLSARKAGPFAPIDCASLPESLIESELFGHEKGAFTGAIERTKGKFELADGGTVFLDEVGNIPLSIQAKLLRFLESHEFERIGGSQRIKTSVRVIAASNVDLMTLSQQGKFRSDLFYRLNEFPIHLPPLRERREDIPVLVNTFLHQLQSEVGREVNAIAPEALEVLKRYDYPGNVRELRNLLKRAMVTANGVIASADLPLQLAEESAELSQKIKKKLSLPQAARQKMQELERQMILEALKKTGGHHGKTASLLGITPRTLYNKIKELNLSI